MGNPQHIIALIAKYKDANAAMPNQGADAQERGMMKFTDIWIVKQPANVDKGSKTYGRLVKLLNEPINKAARIGKERTRICCML